MYRKSCFVCGRPFVNAKILSDHLKTHFPGVDFEPITKVQGKNGLTWNNQKNACKKCKSMEDENKKSKNCHACRKIRLMKMSEKIRRNNGKKNYWTCQKCKKKFNQIAKLMFHKQSCTREISRWRPNPCKMCCKVFLCKNTLERHVQVMHPATKSSDYEKTRSKKCYVCKISLHTVDNIHENELANDLCKKCTKVFTPTIDIKKLTVLKPNLLKSHLG